MSTKVYFGPNFVFYSSTPRKKGRPATIPFTMYAKNESSGKIIVPCVVNGMAVSLPNSQNFPVVQGSTGKIVHYAQGATAEVATAAVDAAAEAFKKWKKWSVAKRRDLLNRVAMLIEQKVDDATRREAAETSCDPHWPAFDCTLAAKFVRETAASASSICGSIPPSDDTDNTSLVFKEAMGVILIIPPWNAPLILSLRGISAALAAGCTVVLKASELSPWSHQLVLEAFEEAGLPQGVLNQVQCSRSDAAAITTAMISHPALRKVEFIGSAAVGRIIGSVAAKYLKPVFMELGDQSPAIILDDANLQDAAQKCVQGALAHHGQVCFGTERIIVDERIKEEFCQALIEAVKAVPSAGSAVTSDGAERAHSIVEQAIADGAQFLVGSNNYTGRTSLEPSILINVDPSSRINKEESFAPAASFFVVKNDEEAVSLANKTDFGLSASIFTSNYARGLKMARELDFGQVQINAITMHVNSAAPVTGFKGSGWGSNNAAYGIGEFMFNKHVSLCP